MVMVEGDHVGKEILHFVKSTMVMECSEAGRRHLTNIALL